MSDSTRLNIAIVGMSGLFPGAKSLDEFWANVLGGVDSSREVPNDRWLISPDRARSDEIGCIDHVVSTRGYFLDDVPTEPEELDPSIRLAVLLARNAWLSAKMAAVDPRRVGIILGHIALPTEFASARAREILTRIYQSGDVEAGYSGIDPTNRFVAGWPAIAAAQALHLGGGALTLDAACASSLYAIKLACDALQSGRVDAMLAGGLSRPDCLYTQMGFSQLRALATNRCAPFDAAGDGLVVGEGGGVFVLKRLADAERDGDAIHGVITGIGLSNDRKGNLLAPASEGQLRAMRAAYRQAGWSPHEVSLIECHATGTPVGDATEFRSLQALWGPIANKQCVIGSVKSNIGHLLTGASSASLIKVLLAIRHAKLPPTANFRTPTAGIDLERNPFRILQRSEEWQSSIGPRRAAISGFGFGGINAHLLIEEYRPQAKSVSSSIVVPSIPCPVAVIGIAVRAGSMTSTQEFAQRLFSDDPAKIHGRIEALEIPLGKYRIPPREFEAMLPQQTLALLTATDCLDDAGLKALPDPENTGVYLGLGLDQNTTNFHFRWSLPANDRDAVEPLTADRTMGALASIAASRIARAIEAGGPSFALSSEETSGVRALELAVRALQRGEVSLALAGAVDLPCDVRTASALPSDLSPTDSSVMLVLERLDAAKEAGHRIYAVIDEIEISSERKLIRDRSDIIFTSLGSNQPVVSSANAIEMESRFGYTGATGSLLAVAAACLSLDQHQIPGRLIQPWLHDAANGPLRTTVVGSGIDRNVVQVSLHAHERHEPATKRELTEHLFFVVGNSIAELKSAVERLRVTVQQSQSIMQAARNWWQGPLPVESHQFRVSIVSEERGHLNQLLNFVESRLSVSELPTEVPTEYRDRLFCSAEPLAACGSLAFVYPGSGNHYAGMGRSVAIAFPDIVRRQQAENQLYRSQWQPDTFWSDSSRLVDPRTAIFGQVVFGSLVSDILAEFGVCPTAAIGISLGTSASFFGLRAWTARDEMYRRMQSSRLFTHQLAGDCEAAQIAWKKPVDWLGGVIACPAEQLREALGATDYVRLLTINTPDECAIGGERSEVERLVKQLGAAFIPFQGVSIAHCDIIQVVANEYRELHRLPTTPPRNVQFYHQINCTRLVLDVESAADAVLAQASSTIDVPKLIESAYADGVRFFAEIGPGASSTRMVGKILAGRKFAARSANQDRVDEVGSLLRLLAHLFAEGYTVDLSPLYRGSEEKPATDSVPSMHLRVRPLPFALRPRDHTHNPTHWDNAPTTCEMDTELIPSQAHEVFPALATAQLAVARAHGEFLRFTAENQKQIAALLVGGEEPPSFDSMTVEQTVFMDRSQCLAFAVGQIGPVLGNNYAAIDQFPTRVRLPDEPLMLVDRILAVEGEPLSLSHGRVITEHDVTPDRWYLDHGRMPVCIAVEAGQADLFLSGYLGIDLHTRGLAVYRLLDAIVTFHRDLPEPTSVVHYDIHIDRFFRQGDTQLFRFRFVGTVDGEPLLTMTEGCAGFFTNEELAAGKGIVHTELDRRPQPGKMPENWQPFVPFDGVEAYSDEQIAALRAGDLPGCFGPTFSQLQFNDPLRLPGGLMHLVDRVTHIDPDGGRFRLGIIRGEADVRPDDWYLTCHFVDDMVMPGTLMYECCLHTLRIYLMRMGWVGEHDDVAWQPVPGVPGRLKCRGQVTAATRKVIYEVSLKEIGYRPEPYAIADVLMYADGKPIVEMLGMSVRLTGTDEQRLSTLWNQQPEIPQRSALYDVDRILAFAVGNPSEAFGELYRPFDRDRVIARLPGPPFQFLDRIVAVEGPPWVMQAGTSADAEYDVPSDAWYFAANGRPVMPFAVLLEIALQPCGWIAAYVGSALTSNTDLSFRNLGGQAIQHQLVGPKIGRLTTRAKLTSVSSSGGMIIQHYEFAVRDSAGRPVYDGTTYFGFFSKAALAEQIGLRDVRPDETPQPREAITYPNNLPFPGSQMRMIDQITRWEPTGGTAGFGLIEGTKRVIPEEWFFKAHFHQDPVVPGSLGLESFLQLLNFIALRRWGEPNRHDWQSIGLGHRHEWTYRGQVIPLDRDVTVRAEVTKIDEVRRLIHANGLLFVDGRPIYRMTDFTLQGWGS